MSLFLVYASFSFFFFLHDNVIYCCYHRFSALLYVGPLTSFVAWHFIVFNELMYHLLSYFNQSFIFLLFNCFIVYCAVVLADFYDVKEIFRHFGKWYHSVR